MALTDAKIRKLTTPSKVTKIADRDGLYIRHTIKNKKIFYVRYQFNGKPQEMDLGDYPTLTLADARTKAGEAKANAKEGKDPKVLKKLEYQENVEQWDVKRCLNYWVEDYAKKLDKKKGGKPKRSTWEKDLQRFEKWIVPMVGDLWVDSTDDNHWLDVFKNIVDEGYPSACIAALSTSKQALTFCRQHGKIKHNPIIDYTNKTFGLKVGQREFQFTHVQIADWWENLEKRKLSIKYKRLLQLLFVYGARSIELRMAQESHFNFDERVWVVPTELNKSHDKPIVRPLIPETIPWIKECIELSKQVGSPYIFYSDDDVNQHILSETLSSAVRGLREWGGGIVDVHWSAHCLRHNFKSWAKSVAEITDDLSDKMTAHKIRGARGIYDNSIQFQEMDQGYRAWWNLLQQIIKRQFKGQVLYIKDFREKEAAEASA